MTLEILFWIIMLLWALSYFAQVGGWAGSYGAWGYNVLLFILILLLGWATFGAPVKAEVAYEINRGIYDLS